MGRSVGDLPSCEGSGEGGLGGGVSAGGSGHGWEGSLDVRGLGPDGNVFHGVVIGDLGLWESVCLGGRGEGVDAGDDTMAVAEAGSEACTGGGGGVAAGVDAEFFGFGEELGFDEGVELFGDGGIAGFVGEAGGYGEEAVGVFEEVGVEGVGEVLGGGFGLGVAARCGEERDREKGCHGDCADLGGVHDGSCLVG